MEFKKLSDVENISQLSTTANILIEESGIIKKTPVVTVVGTEEEKYNTVFNALNSVSTSVEPIDSANVLIEENGVIKKAPKTAVGGNKGEFDAVFHVYYGDDWKNLYDAASENIVLASGGYSNIRNKLMSENDELPKVILRWQASYGDYYYSTIQFTNFYLNGDLNSSNGHGDGYIYLTYTGDISGSHQVYLMRIELHPDNTIVFSATKL